MSTCNVKKAFIFLGIYDGKSRHAKLDKRVHKRPFQEKIREWNREKIEESLAEQGYKSTYMQINDNTKILTEKMSCWSPTLSYQSAGTPASTKSKDGKDSSEGTFI